MFHGTVISPSFIRGKGYSAQQARALDTISAGAIRQPSVVTAEDLRTTTASAINALGTLGASSGGRYIIELRMDVNGRNFIETIEDFGQ